MKWEKVKLGDIADSVLGKMLDRAKNKGELMPYLANLNVRWGDFELENLSLMKIQENERERYGIKYGDLILCEGGEIGRCAIWKEQLPNMMIQKALHRIRPKDERLNNFYLFYWFYNEGKKGAIEQYASGQTTIKHLPAIRLKEIIVDLPPRTIQDKIASILATYDNLIENCRKQIALLEEASQRLYKEWFVDFKFPNHENVPIVDGLPEGWNMFALGDIGIELESGGRPKGGVKDIPSGIPSIGAENVIGLGKYNYSSEKLITEDFFNSMKKGVLRDRDILIYKDGAYIGRTSLFQDGFPHKKASVNEHVFLLRAKNIEFQYFIFFTLYQQKYFDLMQGLNANAAQPGLNQSNIFGIPILLPTNTLITRFNNYIEPIMKSIFARANEIKQLTTARDKLLPRLMSGEIEIKE